MPSKVPHAQRSFTGHPLKHCKYFVALTPVWPTYPHTSPNSLFCLSFSIVLLLSLFVSHPYLSLCLSPSPSLHPLLLAIGREGAVETGPALFSALPLSLHCSRSTEPGPVIVLRNSSSSSSSSLASRLLDGECSTAAAAAAAAWGPSLLRLLLFSDSFSLFVSLSVRGASSRHSVRLN